MTNQMPAVQEMTQFRRRYEKFAQREAERLCKNKDAALLLIECVFLDIETRYANRKLPAHLDAFLMGKTLNVFARTGQDKEALSEEIKRLKALREQSRESGR